MAKIEVVSCDNCGRNSFTDSGLRFDQIQVKRIYGGGHKEPKYVRKIKAPEMHLCEQCIDAFYFSVKLTLKPNKTNPAETFKDSVNHVSEAIETLKEITDREAERAAPGQVEKNVAKRRPGRPRKNPSIETQPLQARAKIEF